MRLLDRYLLGELLVPLFYSLVGFQIFWTAFDLFSNLQMYQERGLGWGQMGKLYFLRTPELLATVLPIALLLALLYSLTNLGRANELIAMRAAGVSLGRISLPLFSVAFFVGVALFVVAEFIAPQAAEKSGRLMAAGHTQAEQELQNLNFQVQDDDLNQTWYVKSYNPYTRQMRQPSVDWKTRDNERIVIDAARAAWTNGNWVFYSAEKKTYRPATSDLPYQVIATNVLSGLNLGGSPEQLQAEIKISQLDRIGAAKHLRLSLSDILAYRKLHPEMQTGKKAMILTQFHGRIAQPFTCLVVVLVALPFGAATGRRNVMAGVAGSVGICFLYFILMRWGLALGTAGHLPAVLAAWLPNLVFASIGLILLRRIP